MIFRSSLKFKLIKIENIDLLLKSVDFIHDLATYYGCDRRGH